MFRMFYLNHLPPTLRHIISPVSPIHPMTSNPALLTHTHTVSSTDNSITNMVIIGMVTLLTGVVFVSYKHIYDKR